MKLSEAFRKIKPTKCTRVTAKGITEIDIVNSSYSIITELFLQDNRITSINNISQFPNLTRIALENNAISNIEELEDLRFLTKLREIRLKGNPICNIPLFHQQVANLFEDYIIIDSKRVHFPKNKAKYENNIIFSLFISSFFMKIQKRPKIDFLVKQLNNFLKKNDYVSFAHKLRYSYLKCDTKTYFIHLKQLCTQKIHKDCDKYPSFDSLSNFISNFYYTKLSHLSEKDIKKLKFPFFNNSPDQTNDANSNTFLPFADVNNFYSCCCFKEKKRNIIPRIANDNTNKKKTLKVETDELSTVAFDIDLEITNDISLTRQANKIPHNLIDDSNINDITISNSFFQSSGNNQNSESSIRKVILKNDSKNWLSMPAIESDFSTFSFQRAVVFSEPFNTPKNNDKKSFKKLSIEESAEFSLIKPPGPHEQHLQDIERIEFLNTSSSSSSNSRSRKSSMKLTLSTTSSSSSSSFTIINSPISSTIASSPPNKQKFSNSPKNNVKILRPNTKMNLPPKLSTSSSSFGNLEADKQEQNIEENFLEYHKSNKKNNDNKNLTKKIKNFQKKNDFSKLDVVSSFNNNGFNMISEDKGIDDANDTENVTKSNLNENEPIKKRKKVRRKKKALLDDSISEVFED